MQLYDLQTQRLGIFEMSGQTFEGLLKLRDRVSLDAMAIEIQRQGARGDTATKYWMFPDRPLTDDERQAITQLELLDLPRILSTDDDAPHNDTAISDHTRAAAAVIDRPTAESLYNRLKALPNLRSAMFLDMFSLQKLTDLPAAKLTAAEQVLHAWELQDHATQHQDQIPF